MGGLRDGLMRPDYHMIGGLHRATTRNSIAGKTAAKGLT
jgi:hypothetical protein